MKKSKIKIIFYFSLLYLILIASISNSFMDILSNYNEDLLSTKDKLIGNEYLKLLNKLSINVLNIQDKGYITKELEVNIEKIHTFQILYPKYKDVNFDEYLLSIKESNRSEISSINYYDFFDYMNNINYAVGNTAGILFSKDKEQYFLGSLLTHYLPEFIISTSISYNILKEFTKNMHIQKSKNSIYIEQSKLMYLSSQELSNIISLLKDKSLNHLSENILLKLEKLKKSTSKNNLIIVDNNIKVFKSDLKTIDEVLTFGEELNYLTIDLLYSLLQVDEEFISNKIIYNKIILSFLILFVTLIFIYIFRIFNLNVEKDEKLEKINKYLLTTIDDEVQKNREKDKQLIQQSKLAQIGEMISMIAHQWRQPLAAISSTSVSLEVKSKLGTLDKETTIELSQNITKYSQHLSSTIDDFRDFFKSEKEDKEVTYNEIIKSVLSIVKVSIENKNILIIQELNSVEKIRTYSNELKQVILNLIKNSEDILIEKKIKNPYIKIITYEENQNLILEVRDNGGGIADDIIDKIFNPYFSTKLEKNGTGLGLYMSKTIIEEHCMGEIIVFNDEYGAVFKIVMKSID